jgi:hypothetical protein
VRTYIAEPERGAHQRDGLAAERETQGRDQRCRCPSRAATVVALVASGATSGNAQILQNGVWSNAVPFTVSIPHLTTVSPASGSSGTSVTITGTGFGAVQGTGGAIVLGSTAGQVVSWSDTQVVAAVATGSLTGIVRIQQNGVWSNALSFTVPTTGGNAVTLAPNLMNLSVGDTHVIEVLNSTGHSRRRTRILRRSGDDSRRRFE